MLGCSIELYPICANDDIKYNMILVSHAMQSISSAIKFFISQFSVPHESFYFNITVTSKSKGGVGVCSE